MNKGGNMSKVNIKVKSFDHSLADFGAKKIVELATKNNTKFSGPVPLPTKREVVTILRSVHINKKSREQFESRTFQRLIVFIDPSEQTIDKLKRLELPSGVEIQVSQK
ncbi:30S ribosomal protein S10 [Mycoplasma bovis]|nr:30S ribosomal protein S10 [Mycoplasmopsis bovis]AEI90302.1 30S ribosomal protein S10 [Mycoplasmopsis bovis Hubei-1]TKA60284.1 30S ribosomal protein S10 [Mycoplasmopsis bovis 1067]ATQ40502.1 30S ribosomal protein S10 [Mycoplasmopsis bovis]AXJ68334.1 30S ribosomal protein S10 [Mycoplasmopsis bovis]AXJ69411.1 30S ribosomal protein S10 [Mycoplasmopsis bovis]